jgi:hypothetical protein
MTPHGLGFRPIEPPRFTVKDVQAHLRKYSASDALQFINTQSKILFDRRHEDGTPGFYTRPGLTITQWDLAFIAKQLILCSNDFKRGKLSEEQRYRGYRHALYLVSNMKEPGLTDNPAPKVEEGYEFLVRMAYQQFRHQEGAEDAFFRTFLLYDKVWRDVPGDFDLEKACQEVYGMPISTFLALGFCLFSLATSEHSRCMVSAFENIDDERLAHIKQLGTPETLQRFWEKVGIDYWGFRELCSSMAVDAAYAEYEFNPLEARPAIFLDRSPNEFVVPSITSMLLRFGEGIYHDLFNYFKAQGSHYPFTTYFGLVFQEYVGQQLRCYYGLERVLDERKYAVPGGEWSGPDWIVVEGDSAILIECTAARLTLPAKSVATWELLKSQVLGKLLGDLRRLPSKTEHIRQHLGVWPELREVSRFYYVVVTLEPWFPADPFQRIVNQELERLGVGQYPYHLLSVGDLESLLCLVPHGKRLSDYFEERIRKGQQGYALGWEFNQMCKDFGVESGNVMLRRARDEFLDTLVPD